MRTCQWYLLSSQSVNCHSDSGLNSICRGIPEGANGLERRKGE